MDTREKDSAATSALVSGFIILLLFGGYVGGYFCLGKTSIGATKYRIGDRPELHVTHYRLRTYPSGWLAKTYEPARIAEILICGQQVHLTHK